MLLNKQLGAFDQILNYDIIKLKIKSIIIQIFIIIKHLISKILLRE